MKVFHAIILGLIQGLTEFLPVSSSGHLLLANKLFDLTEGGMIFTVLLHLGTLAAVLVVYRKRIIEMIMHPVKQKMYWIWMIVATCVTVVLALVLKKLGVMDFAESGRLLGFCFLFTALLLALTDLMRKRIPGRLTVPEMKWYHAAFIGFMQGIAPLPGISRSGATITGATACRLKKDEAAEFSFLLSIPAILGGLVLEVYDALKGGEPLAVNWLCCVVGVITAAVSGYFAVRFMIRLITKRSFLGFTIYTAALGVFVLLDRYVFHLLKW
ncbi:MAG: undecaprenyl-diphosphate phosphatase [Clostridia bacterium]|nr:undecaprenyl-diphosphate phosphatase [Clostridia bacterium]